jgi:hypothetical protein
MKLAIAELSETAREHVLSVGKVDGEQVELTEEQYRELREKYHPNAKDITLALVDAALGFGCIDCGG